MRNISIILGYGVFIPPNANYQKYLEDVLNACLKNQPDLIIVCGGHSSSKYPDFSEAETIRDFYLRIHPELKSKIIIEPNSLSTPENLEFAKNLIIEKYQKIENVIVYCDSCRLPKVFYLSSSQFLNSQNLSEKDRLVILGNIFLSQQPDVSQNISCTYQNLTVVGIPLSDTKELIAYQIMSSMLEMHAFDYPDLHRQFIDWRKKKWGFK